MKKKSKSAEKMKTMETSRGKIETSSSVVQVNISMVHLEELMERCVCGQLMFGFVTLIC